MKTRSYARGALVSIALLGVLALPALAQQPQAPEPRDQGGLELTHTEKPPPIAKPPAQSKEAVGEAEKAVEERERLERERERLREAVPAPPRRPDLDESVTGGIQTRELQKERR